MPEVLQIVGSILLLVAGVAVILYVLFRKSPVKAEENGETAPEDENDEPADENAENDSEDDIPEGEPPAEIEKED
ncbi:MAG: hypothetical protein J5958_02745 [Clostridia bacterium]|nr:hypothetical protein [Clostridia bacterium]MBR5043848.1 hypothetical protein [Clostridia bacterium]